MIHSPSSLPSSGYGRSRFLLLNQNTICEDFHFILAMHFLHTNTAGVSFPCELLELTDDVEHEHTEKFSTVFSD